VAAAVVVVVVAAAAVDTEAGSTGADFLFAFVSVFVFESVSADPQEALHHSPHVLNRQYMGTV